MANRTQGLRPSLSEGTEVEGATTLRVGWRVLDVVGFVEL